MEWLISLMVLESHPDPKPPDELEGLVSSG